MSAAHPGGRGCRLRIERATKRYGATTALDEVSLDLAAGQFLVLLGPSGSGKSTLARSIAGVEKLDAGRVHLGDQLVADGPRQLPPERRNLAMVFQDYALWPHMTVLGNVGYALRRLHLDRSTARARAMGALERVGLAHLAARYPQELSGGEQQRVSLARAIVAEPRLLVFDEPLSNLDADLRERLRIEISTLTRECGATAVYITHDQAEAFALGDRIGVLSSGTMAQLGTPEEIYHRPASTFVARFTGVAAEIPGTVVHANGGSVLVETAAGRVIARPMGEARPGGHVLTLVRPAATRFADPRDGATGVLTGVVADVAYRGRGYEHVVDTAAGLLTNVFSDRARPRGEAVRVLVAETGCLAYDDTDLARYDSHLTPVTMSA